MLLKVTPHLDCVVALCRNGALRGNPNGELGLICSKLDRTAPEQSLSQNLSVKLCNFKSRVPLPALSLPVAHAHTSSLTRFINPRSAIMAPKAAPSHPPYVDMIKAAVVSLKERNGSSLQALKKKVGNFHPHKLCSTFVRLCVHWAGSAGNRRLTEVDVDIVTNTSTSLSLNVIHCVLQCSAVLT